MDRMRVGVWLYGSATIATGVVNIVWLKFEASHQPIAALGHLTSEPVLAVLSGIWLVAAGIALLRRPTAWIGASASALIYIAFALLWVSRYAAMAHAVGVRFDLLVFCLGGAGMQLLLAAPAAVLYAVARPGSLPKGSALAITRWMLGVPLITFAMGHLINTRGYGRFVPHWVPFGLFFVVLTGIAFLLAGCAILARIRDVLAARMLALMLLLFEFTVEIPPAFSNPHSQGAWGGAIYNLTAIGACLVFVEFAGRSQQRGFTPREQLATARSGAVV
ncbi:hypothetical protein [Terriglobus roseus]|uniref:DoxX protein n=1 Tax=Terriglobus roseus TaxID=392734 RepID=A0A1G7KSI4_9BACT|nr:hypothetical protein [Terriglobus roseus]SDF40034.1 hypothetical protein SAMN05444167_2287 [Terriglobus roseus]